MGMVEQIFFLIYAVLSFQFSFLRYFTQ